MSDELKRIVIPDFPFPPTSNHLFVSFYKGGKVRRVKHKNYVEYLNLVNTYHWSRENEFRAARESLKDNQSYNIICYFLFPYERVYTKKGGMKICDVSNRGKALFDSLSTCLGIDDKYFNRVEMHKCVADTKEKVVIIIEPVEVLTESEVLTSSPS